LIGGGETVDDLVCDVIEVLTGMCRGRRVRSRRLRALTAAKHQPRLVEVTGSR